MPNKIESHDSDVRQRLNKIGAVLPANLAKAKKYRSSGNWQKVVSMQKKEFPLCCDPFKDHKKDGRMIPMDQVHHIRELAKFFHLRAYKKNLRSICTGCHSKISVLERQNRPTYHFFKEMPEF